MNPLPIPVTSELSELKAAFDLCDLNSVGQITHNDLKIMFHSLGHGVYSHEVAQIMHECCIKNDKVVDDDSNVGIGFAEFLVVLFDLVNNSTQKDQTKFDWNQMTAELFTKSNNESNNESNNDDDLELDTEKLAAGLSKFGVKNWSKCDLDELVKESSINGNDKFKIEGNF